MYNTKYLYVNRREQAIFLVFSSPEPKTQVSFSDQFFSLSVVVVDVNFSYLLLRNH